jgi:hypothetical protein
MDAARGSKGAGTVEMNEMKSFYLIQRLLLTLTIGLMVLGVPAAAQQATPCDLNSDGTVNEADRTLAISMSLGQATCSANILANGACNVVMVQRVVNAMLGGGCMTDIAGAHSVTLNWVASSTPNVTYRVYRSLTSGGPYSLVRSNVGVVSYFDTAVEGGRTYYYVVTAVDGSGNASIYSNQAMTAVPTT